MYNRAPGPHSNANQESDLFRNQFGPLAQVAVGLGEMFWVIKGKWCLWVSLARTATSPSDPRPRFRARAENGFLTRGQLWRPFVAIVFWRQSCRWNLDLFNHLHALDSTLQELKIPSPVPLWRQTFYKIKKIQFLWQKKKLRKEKEMAKSKYCNWGVTYPLPMLWNKRTLGPIYLTGFPTLPSDIIGTYRKVSSGNRWWEAVSA